MHLPLFLFAISMCLCSSLAMLCPEKRPGGDNACLFNISGAVGSQQNPSLGPDGKTLVYTDWTKNYNNARCDSCAVYVKAFNVETGASQKLTDGVNLPGVGVWSRQEPRTVVFVNGDDHAVTYNIDTGNKTVYPRRVSNGKIFEPTFSPDGKWLVFEEHSKPAKEDKQEMNGEIVKMEVATKKFTVLTTDGWNKQPYWSPAGDLIVFQQCKKTNIEDIKIYSIRTDGSAKKLLDGAASDVSFSPDGQYILYSNEEEEGIWCRKADGSGERARVCLLSERAFVLSGRACVRKSLRVRVC